MEDINWITFLLVMGCMVLADICWVYYFIKIDERKSIQAGFWGSIIYIFSAVSILNYTHNTVYVIAAVIGSFLGTYISVEYKKNKEVCKPAAPISENMLSDSFLKSIESIEENLNKK